MCDVRRKCDLTLKHVSTPNPASRPALHPPQDVLHRPVRFVCAGMSLRHSRFEHDDDDDGYAGGGARGWGGLQSVNTVRVPTTSFVTKNKNIRKRCTTDRLFRNRPENDLQATSLEENSLKGLYRSPDWHCRSYGFCRSVVQRFLL